MRRRDDNEIWRQGIEHHQPVPDEEEALQAMERAYDRFISDHDSPRDYRNGVAVGSRLSLVEYQDDERDWS